MSSREDRIRQEVGAILAQCMSAPRPLAYLDDNYRRLSHDRKWSEEDVLKIYRSALRVLLGILNPEAGAPTERDLAGAAGDGTVVVSTSALPQSAN